MEAVWTWTSAVSGFVCTRFAKHSPESICRLSHLWDKKTKQKQKKQQQREKWRVSFQNSVFIFENKKKNILTVFNISQNNRWEFVKYYFKKQKNKEKRLN